MPNCELRSDSRARRVIGFAGSFYGYEGLDLLVDALAILAPRLPDLHACSSAGDRRKRRCARRSLHADLAIVSYSPAASRTATSSDTTN